MKNLPLVSIVIPVYNEGKYIAQCIDSVLGQTFTNWEGIIVNNCSTDETLEIAMNYEKTDKRFRIYNNAQFLTQINNHNMALTKMSPSSKYCKMVLGDDFIYPECLEKMVEVAESDSSVGIVSSYRLIDSRVGNIGLPFGKPVHDGRSICRMHMLDEDIYLFGSQTSVMFRSEIVRKRTPFFGNSGFFVDAEVCFDILKDHNFGFVNQILTYTRRENESALSSITRFNPVLLTRFMCLNKYGKMYLDEREYRNRYADLSRKYYSYLGKKVFTNKDREFWNFHKEQFNRSGIEWRNGEIVKGALCFLIDSILNPKNTISYLFSKHYNGLTL